MSGDVVINKFDDKHLNIYRAIIMTEFESWLSKKLQDLKTDEGVFLPYIISILEGGDETEEDKKDGITGLLADVLDNEDDIEKAYSDIIAQFEKLNKTESMSEVSETVDKLDITEKMHAITQEKIANSLVRKVEKTEEEKRLKQAILNGFAGGGRGDDSGAESDDGGEGLGPANTNAESVQREVQENREKQAAAAAAKKEKDKQDRLNQKNQAEERKKKAQEKAAKGERKSGR